MMPQMCLNCRTEYDPILLFCPECGSSEALLDYIVVDTDDFQSDWENEVTYWDEGADYANE